jgi:large subunit ribosomal protein L32e
MTTDKDSKKLLDVRKKIKSRKPTFIQQDYHKKDRLKKRWKRPTGLQSKMRHQLKGYSRRVKQGWRSPSDIRGFHGKGVDVVLISNVSQLDTVPKGSGIIISGNVGMKKKLAIVEKAEHMKILVVNIKADKLKEKVSALKAKSQEDKKTRDDKKKKTLEESLKKAEKDKKDKEKIQKRGSDVSDAPDADAKDADAGNAEEKRIEEKKIEEKKIKDEVLIHKQ